MEPATKGMRGNGELFRRLGEGLVGLLGSVARLSRFESGARIFCQDEACPGPHRVGSGIVRVHRTAASAKNRVPQAAEAGTTFAEVGTVGRSVCPAHTDALEDTACALLPTDGFHRLLETNRLLCLQFVEGVAYWVGHLVGLLKDIVLRDAGGRGCSPRGAGGGSASAVKSARGLVLVRVPEMIGS